MHVFMREEGITTKLQIFYNNNHTSTLQASIQKIYRSRKHKHNTKETHTQKNIHTYLHTQKNIHRPT